MIISFEHIIENCNTIQDVLDLNMEVGEDEKESEGCGKMFSSRTGHVGRPNLYPCVKGHLCDECKEKESEGE